jgi:putative FmdB family regulatory protein
MPFYEYSCPKCGMTFDLMRPMADRDDPAACPECGFEKAKREISTFTAAAVSGGDGGSCGGGSGAFT